VDILELAKNLGTYSPAGLFILALIGLYKKWWVPGWIYEAALKRGDYYQTGFLRLLNVAEANLPKGHEGSGDRT
jgi:hypothetical protein